MLRRVDQGGFAAASQLFGDDFGIKGDADVGHSGRAAVDVIGLVVGAGREVPWLVVASLSL